jgi:hypothetical protein
MRYLIAEFAQLLRCEDNFKRGKDCWLGMLRSSTAICRVHFVSIEFSILCLFNDAFSTSQVLQSDKGGQDLGCAAHFVKRGQHQKAVFFRF